MHFTQCAEIGGMLSGFYVPEGLQLSAGYGIIGRIETKEARNAASYNRIDGARRLWKNNTC